jgi:hypothetical protein
MAGLRLHEACGSSSRLTVSSTVKSDLKAKPLSAREAEDGRHARRVVLPRRPNKRCLHVRVMKSTIFWPSRVTSGGGEESIAAECTIVYWPSESWIIELCINTLMDDNFGLESDSR